MSSVDDRLVDLFAAIDAQVTAPPLPGAADADVASVAADAGDAEAAGAGAGARDVASLQVGVVGMRRRRVRTLVAAGAAVAAIAAAVALVASRPDRSGDTPVEVAVGPAATQPGPEFTAAVSTLCVALDDARAGVRPRFATGEAYEVAAANRRQAIDAFAGGLAELAPPDDDPAAVSRTLVRLRDVRSLLDLVALSAMDGDLDAAETAFTAVDVETTNALADLRARGAAGCS